MITPTGPLPRNRHFDLLLQNRLELPDEAHMCYSLLHHNRNGLGASLPTFIHRILEHLYRDTIPSHTFAARTYLLLQSEVAIQLQIKGMVLPDLGMWGLVDNLPGDMELRALRVEVEVLDSDFEGEMNSRRGCGTGFLSGCHPSDCAGAEEIAWSD